MIFICSDHDLKKAFALFILSGICADPFEFTIQATVIWRSHTL